MGCGSSNKKKDETSSPTKVYSIPLKMLNEEGGKLITARVFDNQFTGFEVQGWKMKAFFGDGIYGSTFLMEKGTESMIIKIMDKESEEPDPQLTAAFAKLRIMTHPNIIQMNNTYEEGGQMFVEREFIEAKPLKVDIADKIKNEETYSEADAINLMLQMAKGCEYLHMNDLNHKGLNTMKVLVTPSKQIKICDFGLATIVDAEGFRLGAAPAPIYTAPEIFFGEKYTYEPDIWSMGAIFYEILTLKQAFNRPYTQEIIIAIRNQTYDKELLRKHSNDKLYDLITKMLIKKEHRIKILGGEPEIADEQKEIVKAEKPIESTEIADPEIIEKEEDFLSTDILLCKVLTTTEGKLEKVVRIGLESHKSKSVDLVNAPTECINFGEEFINNRIFLVGGRPGYSIILEVKTETGEVATHGNMINGREFPGCVVVYTPKPQLYILGGMDNEGKVINLCENYDICNAKAKMFSPLPVPKMKFGITDFDGDWIYTFGGYGANQEVLDRIDRVCILPVGRRRMNREWEQVEISNFNGWSGRVRSGTVQYHNSILIFGGIVDEKESSQTLIFSIEEATFEQQKPLLKEDNFTEDISIRFGDNLGVIGDDQAVHMFNFMSSVWNILEKDELGFQLTPNNNILQTYIIYNINQ